MHLQRMTSTDELNLTPADDTNKDSEDPSHPDNITHWIVWLFVYFVIAYSIGILVTTIYVISTPLPPSCLVNESIHNRLRLLLIVNIPFLLCMSIFYVLTRLSQWFLLQFNQSSALLRLIGRFFRSFLVQIVVHILFIIYIFIWGILTLYTLSQIRENKKIGGCLDYPIYKLSVFGPVASMGFTWMAILIRCSVWCRQSNINYKEEDSSCLGKGSCGECWYILGKSFHAIILSFGTLLRCSCLCTCFSSCYQFVTQDPDINEIFSSSKVVDASSSIIYTELDEDNHIDANDNNESESDNLPGQ